MRDGSGLSGKWVAYLASDPQLGLADPETSAAITIGAMCAAALVSTVGVSGSTPPTSHAVASNQHPGRVATP